MEDNEKKVINTNLDALVKCTICNDSLLTNLQRTNVLSPEDVQVVEAETTDLKKAHKFYKIIVTKVNYIAKLKVALAATSQSKALQILNDNEFETMEILGKGNYGTVYKSKLLGLDVAIKRLQIDDTKDTEKEINILTKYSKHENIVGYLGCEKTDKCILIYMELCEINLKDWMTKKDHSVKILPLDILKHVTRGLEWLHGHNIVHMDLKPENILLTCMPCKAKISDFGFSKRILDGKSGVSMAEAGGTRGWLAPEVIDQAQEESPGKFKYIYKPASDIFALGCVYYFVLTDGMHAFGPGAPDKLQANIINRKSSMNRNLVKHGCRQNIYFILLMTSENVQSRPTCSTLLSSPLFWSVDRSYSFIHDLMTYDEAIWCHTQNFNERMKCNLEHKMETDMLIKADKTVDKADRCVIVMAYLMNHTTKGALERYYNGTNSFALNELSRVTVLPSKPKETITVFEEALITTGVNLSSKDEHDGNRKPTCNANIQRKSQIESSGKEADTDTTRIRHNSRYLQS